MNRIYLDNAATTPIRPEVLDSMLPYFKDYFGNPSAIYSYGREAKAGIEKSRSKVANLLGVKPGEIFFTSGGTESTNTALWNSVLDLGVKRIISTDIEHHATMHTIRRLHELFAVQVEYINLTDNGSVDYNHLQKLLENSTEKTLVTLMHANNEIGNMLDVEKVGDLCEQSNALFHVDMVQTIGHYDLNLSKLKIHLASGSSHKYYGPKGVGLLYINEGITIQPFMQGGAQERNMRAGTENITGIVGLSTALEIAMNQLDEEKAHINSLKQYAKQKFLSEIEGVVFHGDTGDDSHYTVLNVGLPKSDKMNMIIYHLDMKGICVSGGSACTSGIESVSHVIQKVNPDYQNIVPMRISFGVGNTKQDIDTLVEEIKNFIK